MAKAVSPWMCIAAMRKNKTCNRRDKNSMKIPNFNRKSPLQKEWDTLCKKEQAFLGRRRKKKETALNQLLAEKVPEKLQHTLDLAFEKAFSLVFEKGTGVIEKTYNKDAMEKEFRVNLYADEVYGSRKSLRAFSKKAGKAGGVNLTLSGVSGVGMGILGIGLPDIPVFTGMILKCIYETAVNYGFDYHSESERYFVLLLIEGAVSYGEHLEEIDGKIEAYMIDQRLPDGYVPAKQVADTSSMLSKELLYMKFLQGIPIIGAVGGAYDVVYMKQISEYAKLKYQKRFLVNYKGVR